MRLFIAINFSEKFRNVLLDTMRILRNKGFKGNYVSAENLHMMLCFIGETEEVDEIKAAMKTVSFNPFRLSLGSLGTFGNLLWVGTNGGDELKRVVGGIRAKLDFAGIVYDRKKFRPHITIIRKMAGNIPDDFVVPEAEMIVNKISLMKSERLNGKMVYTEIFSI